MPRGAAPRGARLPGGVPISPEKWGERGPGASPLDPRFLWPLVPTRWFLGSLSLVRSWGYDYRYPNTDLGRIFPEKYAEKAFLRKNISAPLRLHPPKPSPWGEGAPVRTLGRMRGRSCTQPFLVDAEKGGSRLSPQRNFSSAPLGNPVAPSSVTFGDSFPPRGSLRRCYTPATQFILAQPLLPQNANPNQGTYMGPVIAPLPSRCATQRQNQRVGTSGP